MYKRTNSWFTDQVRLRPRQPEVLCLLVLAGALTIASPAQVADWPTFGGNPQRTNFQANEGVLGPKTVSGMVQLWSRKLGIDSGLSAPTILGRIISHRGFEELVYVANEDGQVFAVDADLNRLSWNAQTASDYNPETKEGPCVGKLVSTPMFVPLEPGKADDDEDNPAAQRPVYSAAGNGKLYTLRPMTGSKLFAPKDFSMNPVQPTSLSFLGGRFYASTSNPCGKGESSVWGIPAGKSKAAVISYNAGRTGTSSFSTTTIGKNSKIYLLAKQESGTGDSQSLLALNSATLRLEKSWPLPKTGAKTMKPLAMNLEIAPSAFQWRGQSMVAGTTGNGKLFLLNVDRDRGITTDPFAAKMPADDVYFGNVVVRPEKSNTWIYALCQTQGSTKVIAFKLVNAQGKASLTQAWNSVALTKPRYAAVANGVLYATSDALQETLSAFDADSGKQLYASDTQSAAAEPSAPAIANGHVCFTAKDLTLRCFGLPLDL